MQRPHLCYVGKGRCAGWLQGYLHIDARPCDAAHPRGLATADGREGDRCLVHGK